MKMTVTRALAELKLVKKRVSEIAAGFRPLAIIIGQNSKVTTTNHEITKFNSEAKAVWQGYLDLVARWKSIKKAIVASNATTKITVNGAEMLVADAIELKAIMSEESKSIANLKSVMLHNEREINSINQNVDAKLEKIVLTMMGSDKSKRDGAEIDTFMSQYKANNYAYPVDPLGLKDLIQKLQEETQAFQHEIDFALSESNAKTEVEI